MNDYPKNIESSTKENPEFQKIWSRLEPNMKQAILTSLWLNENKQIPLENSAGLPVELDTPEIKLAMMGFILRNKGTLSLSDKQKNTLLSWEYFNELLN